MEVVTAPALRCQVDVNDVVRARDETDEACQEKNGALQARFWLSQSERAGC